MNKKRQLILAIAAILLVGLGITSGYYLRNNFTETSIPHPQPTVQEINVSKASIPTQTNEIADIAEKVIDSVVNISSEKIIKTSNNIGGFGPFQNDPFFRRFFELPDGQPSPEFNRKEKSLGSGVIVSEKGIILTNNHVIENAETIRVSLSNGKEVEAEILGTDPASDLGVLKLIESIDNLKPLKIGDSNQLRLGEVVLAVGNPFGVGQTVTMGIVSAKGRANVGIVEYEDFIQTDAAINPGNSGGALVNLKGELIGINTAILSRSGGYQGIGFAIPSNMAEPIMKSLVNKGKVVRGWLGIGIQDMTSELAKAFSLENTKGVLVSEVIAGSPAEKGGLLQGDVILNMNGKQAENTAKLRNLIANAGADNIVKLDIFRENRKQTIEVKLEEKSMDVSSGPQKEMKNDSFGGLYLENLTPINREQFLLSKNDQGVLVTNVEMNSIAAQHGFQKGDLIQRVNSKRIKNISGFKAALRSGKSTTVVLVKRQQRNIFLVLPSNLK